MLFFIICDSVSMISCLNDESDPEDRLSPRPVLARYVKKIMLIFSKLHRADESIISHLFNIFFFVFSIVIGPLRKF